MARSLVGPAVKGSGCATPVSGWKIFLVISPCVPRGTVVTTAPSSTAPARGGRAAAGSRRSLVASRRVRRRGRDRRCRAGARVIGVLLDRNREGGFISRASLHHPGRVQGRCEGHREHRGACEQSMGWQYFHKMLRFQNSLDVHRSGGEQSMFDRHSRNP